MGENFILGNLQDSVAGLTKSMTTMVEFLTRDPTTMPHAWGVVQAIYNTMLPIGYSLITLFFLIGFIKTTTDFRNISIEKMFGMFLLLILSKFLMERSFDILRLILSATHGLVDTLGTTVAIPEFDVEEYRAVISGLNIFEKAQYAATMTMYNLVFKGVSIAIKAIIYGVFIEIFVLTAMSPIPIAGIASGEMSPMAKRYLQEYAAVALQAVVMLIVVTIYGGFMAEYALDEDPVGKMLLSSILFIMILFKSGSYSRKLTGV